MPTLTGTTKIILAALTALLIALAVWWLYSTWTAKPKAEARLGKNTTEAAQASGKDAVNTVGQASDREAKIDDLTRTNERDIRNAQGADAAVAAPARDAGLRSLCSRASYRLDPRCVQQPNPR